MVSFVTRLSGKHNFRVDAYRYAVFFIRHECAEIELKKMETPYDF